MANSLEDVKSFIRRVIDWDYDASERQPEDWYGGGNFDDAYYLGQRDGEQDVYHAIAEMLNLTEEV